MPTLVDPATYVEGLAIPRLVSWNPSSFPWASFRCVHRKADEGGIPGRMPTEENAARCVPARRAA
jgi:hypothetical protein